jgi:TRAP-type uncharacterized transport system substrate-binding protein
MDALDPDEPPRPRFLRMALLVLALVALAGFGAWFLQSTIPRHIVMASGVKDGRYHELAQRYKAILARDGVTIEERFSQGSGDNARMLLDPKSGVDVAFMQAGVLPAAEQGDLEMIASLYYEPLWVFYRSPDTLTRLVDLRYKRVAVGAPGGGARAFADPLLAANNLTGFNTQLVPLAGVEAVRALQRGEVDAVFLVGAVQVPAIWQALHDPDLKLMSFSRADAYTRRFPYITKLTLPAGSIDFSLGIPGEDVTLIGTKAMLVARDGLPPAITNLLFEAARDVHSEQGNFERAGEFPSTDRVDLPVSNVSDGHRRFGPSLLHRYLPFFFASFLERLIILLVPLLVVIVPIVNYVPQFLAWRVRSRIYRWYGELAVLERDVAVRTGTLPIDKWLANLDRIEAAAEHIRTPTSYASESYTLREHINLVRRTVLAKAEAQARAGAPTA